jgi:translation initiation factor IF-1
MAGDTIEAVGTINGHSRGDLFEVTCEIAGKSHRVLAKRSGKLVKNWIYVVVGDRVRVEISPYDLSRGRITHRLQPGDER